MKIELSDYSDFLSDVKGDSVDLLLTDPPYNISHKTGFKSVGKKGVKRFAVSKEFGYWDKEINLDNFSKLSYAMLRKGGTAIVFYNFWTITNLFNSLTKAGFVQFRAIKWNKTNPMPINSSRNYLTSCGEVAILCVKGGKPTFNSKFDCGIYTLPTEVGKKRFHPTQKPIKLIDQLMIKHSNEDDLVCDPFLGSGTTAVSCVKNNRRFIGCDFDKKYIQIAKDRVDNVAPLSPATRLIEKGRAIGQQNIFTNAIQVAGISNKCDHNL